MTRERIGQVVFLVAVAVAAALYALTAPAGLPWNESTHRALAYLGEIARLPTMAHPIWGRMVEVFGGNIALSCACAAFGAGLLGALVNRYFGWRAATAAAVAWVWMPGVWNRAITGERGVCLWAMAVAAAWMANVVALWVTRKVRTRAARWSAPTGVGVAGGDNLGAPTAHGKYAKLNRIAGWAAMGAAGIFAVVSMSFHNYRLGEAASVFARGVVAEAGDRIIVANGLCDDQLVRAVRGTGRSIVLLRNDAEYRKELIAWVRREWPNATKLWVAAEVSPTAFVQAATRHCPERFYLMNGDSTTAEGWERRWAEFAPHLQSSDPFVAAAKLAFAYEGEAVAGRLELAGDGRGAKRLRERLPQVGSKERKRVVRNVAQGTKCDIAPEILSLIEWSNEMTAAMERGDEYAAGRIARAILSNPAWARHIPANAIMGTIAAGEGDYMASAAFFKVAVATTNAVPPVVLNDYADVLMHLDRLDQAEVMARRAVATSGEDFWLARLTLAEVLEKRSGNCQLVEMMENGHKVECCVKPEGADKMEAEAKALLKFVLRQAPESVRGRIRNEHTRLLR